MLHSEKRLLLPELQVAAVAHGEWLRRGEREGKTPGAQLVVECSPYCLATAKLLKSRRRRTELDTEDDSEEVAPGVVANVLNSAQSVRVGCARKQNRPRA